ncbi:MAG: hypothetical protein GEU92_12335 [Alphaproteobacteria bacterium]|nr:hypothetical protein [Alphaproteobacteria bacterium]
MLIESEIRSPVCTGRHSADALVLLWTMRLWYVCPCGSRHVHDYYARSLPPAARRIAFEDTARMARILVTAAREPLRLQSPDFLWLTGHETILMRAFDAAREGGYAVAFFEAGQLLRFDQVTLFVEALTRLGAALEAGPGGAMGGEVARPSLHG